MECTVQCLDTPTVALVPGTVAAAAPGTAAAPAPGTQASAARLHRIAGMLQTDVTSQVKSSLLNTLAAES